MRLKHLFSFFLLIVLSSVFLFYSSNLSFEDSKDKNLFFSNEQASEINVKNQNVYSVKELGKLVSEQDFNQNSFSEEESSLIISQEQKSAMAKEVADFFESNEMVDVVVILNQLNLFVSDSYTGDYQKKQEELNILIDNFLMEFSKDEIEIIQKGKVTRFIALRIHSQDTLKKLDENYYVDYYFLDKKQDIHLSESNFITNADRVEASYGLTGQGVTICVIDSGIDYTHTALGGCSTSEFLAGNCSKVVGGIDFYASTIGGVDSDPFDTLGHGTHVSGIIASNDSTYNGIAPGADIASVKIYEGAGGNYYGGTFSATMAGIDWCVLNKDSFNNPIRIITMSFGIGSTYTEINSPTYYDPSLIVARNALIFLDASAGNEFSSVGISYPASSRYVFSVGSSYDGDIGPFLWTHYCNDLETALDKISCFTNRYSGLDILAPGSAITSTRSSIGFSCRNPLIGQGFATCSGTSMAAPHVAGAAALILENNPTLKPSRIEYILRSSGVPVYDPVTSLAFPRLDISRAISGRTLTSLYPIGEPNVGRPFKIGFFDPAHPKKYNYLVLFSSTTSPGINLPYGHLNLIFDSVMHGVLSNPASYWVTGSSGVLNNFGYGSTTINYPSNLPVGITIYSAGITLDPSKNFPFNVIAISPSIPITTLPPINNLQVTNMMPSNLSYSSCVESSILQRIYCFGGSKLDQLGAPTDEILEYNPYTNAVTIKSAKTPIPIVASSCSEDSSTNLIHCIGGSNYLISTSLSKVLFAYDPLTDSIINSTAAIPNTLAFWNGLSCAEDSSTHKIYCFGGVSNAGILNSIVKYDPLTDSISYMSSTLPEGTQLLSCAEDSSTHKIYCFGGLMGGTYTPSYKVLEYDPVLDVIIQKSATLPYGLSKMSCVEKSTNHKIYCFGGNSFYPAFPEVVLEYDPSTDSFGTTYGEINPGREALSCAEDTYTSDIYCFGGEQSPLTWTSPPAILYNEILRYS